MLRKTVSTIVLFLFLLVFMSVININPVEAYSIIYIRADGSIDPDTAPISTFDNATYTFTDNFYGMVVVERDNIVVDGQGYRLHGPGAAGLLLSGRSNVTAKNLVIKEFGDGARVYSSRKCVIRNSNITNNHFYGVELRDSKDSEIANNDLSNNRFDSLLLWSTNNSAVVGNNMSYNQIYGMRARNSNDNIIEGNQVTNNNLTGIWFIGDSHNNSLTNNFIANHRKYGIHLYGSSDNNIVYGNNITNNEYGLSVYESTNNTITGNNITNNEYGIWLWLSSENIVFENNITDNNIEGIRICASSNYNVISENIIENNNFGIWTEEICYYNSICHNNFMNNVVQVRNGGSCINAWDCDYPSGGNYWNDYVERYPVAMELNNSGLWDTPYVIDENNQDNYPLMEPWPLIVEATPPTMRIEPENYTASCIDQVFRVNVTIKDLHVSWCMSSVWFELKYNSSILEVLDVADGPLMKDVAEYYSGAKDDFPWYTPYEFLWVTVPSSVLVGIIIYHPPVWMRVYPEGNGTLAVITFRATAGPKAQCFLMLKNVSLLDEWVNGIPCNTEDGFYRILVGDLNIDSKVDMQDVGIAARAFGSYPGHERWNRAADVNNDDRINLRDIALIARHFGLT